MVLSMFKELNTDIGEAIKEVMEQATDKENIAPLTTVGVDKLDTEMTIEDGHRLKDDLGIERIEIHSTLNPIDKDGVYRIDGVDIYAGAKLLNQSDFDKIDIPNQDGVITARVHIVDGEFIATVDSSLLLHPNVDIDESADPSKFKDLSLVKGNINLKDFSEQDLIDKFDNLFSKGIRISVASELGFDMNDLDTGKLEIVADRIKDIIKGHVVYNVSFDESYTKEEFADRIKGVGNDLATKLPNNKSDTVKSRINICGNMLKDKEYFTVQGVFVNSDCGKSIQELYHTFDSVTLTDKNNKEVDMRARRF